MLKTISKRTEEKLAWLEANQADFTTEKFWKEVKKPSKSDQAEIGLKNKETLLMIH